MRPPSTRVASVAKSSDARFEPSRSAAMKSALPPAARISATTLSPRSWSRPLTTTCAPSPANMVAIARPMLLVAPVTSAVLFSSRVPVPRAPFVSASQWEGSGAGRSNSATQRRADSCQPFSVRTKWSWSSPNVHGTDVPGSCSLPKYTDIFWIGDNSCMSRTIELPDIARPFAPPSSAQSGREGAGGTPRAWGSSREQPCGQA
jgi:hypothetical protein